MQRPTNWLIVLAVAGLAAMVACVLILPRLLYPPLPAAILQDVPTARERIELQQAQSALQNDVRTPLLQGLGGLLLVAGVVATWQQVLIGREGQITERFTRAIDQLGNGKLDVRSVESPAHATRARRVRGVWGANPGDAWPEFRTDVVSGLNL